MNKTAISLLTAFVAVSSLMKVGAEELKVTADRLAVDRVSGALAASGHVYAVSHPFRLMSDELTRDAERRYVLSDPTTLTTCTNETCDLHWRMTGEAEFSEGHYVLFRNMWVHMWDVPVMWLPYWYYPMDTDYGLRVMPGYTSRWGGYLLTKYVYHIAGDRSGEDGTVGLGGNTRVDLRTKNGVALGQSVNWRLGDFGRGKFKVYYAWDEDYDRYKRNWVNNSKWNYENWGSIVSRKRYSFDLSHRWEPTERDVVRGQASYFSDSYFASDFLRQSLLSPRNVFFGENRNELAWEHNETLFGLGVSVSGPLSEYAGGVARLPEAYFTILPQPLLGLPVNYESETHVGYLDRRPQKNGNSQTALAYRYVPGRWAEYNAFRLDTYHRLTLPFKVGDVVSVVPRVGVRGTYWSDCGYENIAGVSRAGSTGDDMSRFIAEGGVTFAARGVAWIDDRWQHMVEPYMDFLAQEATYYGDGTTAAGVKRPYVFDAIDASIDWQDQFAGRARNLPYSWYGVTPGLRNALRAPDSRGNMRTILDFDVYAAVQFNDTAYTPGGRYHRLARLGDPNYGAHKPFTVPGVRVRWLPANDISLALRAEYDAQRDSLAFADLDWRQMLTDRFRYYTTFVHRDYRWWDFSSAPFSPSEKFSFAHFSYVELGCEYDLCDPVAVGPYIRWSVDEDDLEEIGSWIDYRTDCLGFRLQVAYAHDYKRIDGSEYEHDWRVGFFVYLRAFGPNWGSVLGD